MIDGYRVPRRIILSRKGWDSSAGGRPSPILPDGTLLSLPIPDPESGVKFDDLQLPNGRKEIGDLVEDLTKRRVHRTHEVHLDPDIRDTAIKRINFQPAFGQCGGSQSHLEKQGVRKEMAETDADLFLFFGLYRQVTMSDRWRYVRTAPEIHVIFAWLQVEKIIRLPEESVPAGLERHPHAIQSGIVRKELARLRSKNNTMYLPRKRLTFRQGMGSGIFAAPFDIRNSQDPRRLSSPSHSKCSLWRLPPFFAGLSNMGKQPAPAEFWEPQRKGFGQEFVLDTQGREIEIEKWLTNLFDTCSGC